MSHLTANDAHDDFEGRDEHTFILRATDGAWKVSFDVSAPALQPENAPYN